jgi:hypothetical protein
MWKRLDTERGEQMVAMDRSVLVSGADGKRMSVDISNTGPKKGSTLIISLARDEDAGQYICEMASSKSLAIKHTVDVRGEFRMEFHLFCSVLNLAKEICVDFWGNLRENKTNCSKTKSLWFFVEHNFKLVFL